MSEFDCLKCGQRVAWRMLPSFKDPCAKCGRYVDVVNEVNAPATIPPKSRVNLPDRELETVNIAPMPKLEDGYPEIEFCSACRDNAIFTQDPDDESGEWLSVCCGARAISPDVEPDDLEGWDNGK